MIPYERQVTVVGRYEFAGPTGGFHAPVALGEISPYLIDATIATEDADFYSNPGLNFRGLARAVFENLAFWEHGGFLRGSGGSSITQQVVKNLRLFGENPPQRNPLHKLHEILLALALNRLYSKDQVLEWYLNSVFYGSAAYGAEAAAQRYFGKPASELTLAEAAMLAGIPNAPDAYNVFGDFEAVKERQQQVLGLMVRHSYVSREEAEAVYEAPLVFESASFPMQAPHFTMYVHELLPRLVGKSAAEGGLRVTTTLDLSLQRRAEEIVEGHLQSLERRLGAVNGALVALDPASGEILAMVGGRSFFDDPISGQVNNALALNQPGSSIKPITYLAAFEKGWAPATIVPDQPIRLNDGTRSFPLRNFDGRYSGQVSAREALGNSLNVPAVHALQFAGLANVHHLAARMGLTTLQDVRNYGASFTLGGADVTLLDLAFGYSVLANGGEQRGMPSITESSAARRPLDPVAILKVENASGQSLWEYRTATKQIAAPAHVYLVTHVLSDNGARTRTFGPNSLLNLPGRPAAVKTGLTDDNRDAWAVGYTPQLVTGVWVGRENNSAMVGATSVQVAAPIWHRFMVAALVDEPALPFEPPTGVQLVPVCRSTGLPAAGRRCSQTVTEVFAPGQLPTGVASGEAAGEPAARPKGDRFKPRGRSRGRR